MFKTPFALLGQHKDAIKIPRSVQDTIPINRVWQDGIFLSGKVFSKSWRITDVNYALASYDEKKAMFLDYSSLLNAIDAGTSAKISIINRRINRDSLDDILLPLHGDDLDKYRRELNEILVDKALENNAIMQEKYITLSVVKKTVEEARSYFGRAGTELAGRLAALKSVCIDMNAHERLRIFHDFYRPGDENDYHFDFKENLAKKHDVRDYIAPSGMKRVDSQTLQIGDSYARVLFVREYAKYIKDNMLSELSDLSKSMVLTIDVLPIPTDEAQSEVDKRSLGVETNISNWQTRQNKHGNYAAVIPMPLENARRETREMSEDLTNRDQRMYLGFISIVHVADSKQELDNDTESLVSTAKKHLCQLDAMRFRQIQGLQNALPFGVLRVDRESFRTLTTESLAIFSPFKAMEIQDKGGIYYGQNAISRNMIMVDRKALINGNGMILGIPGSGKSFLVKLDILNIILNSEDDVLIIDPEAEYYPLVEALKGTTIRIAADSLNHINAMDMNASYSETETGRSGNPTALKVEFILSLCEMVMGEGRLGAQDKSIVDRCVTNVYRDYILNGYQGQVPTLVEFYDELMRQPEIEARDIALAIELFTKGSLNTFAQQSNVNTNDRLVCYNIRDLGNQLKSIGMLVVLDSIFNRITRNRSKGKRTWIVIDELYLLFANEYSSNYLYELWKRVRKYGGCCTGLTQNSEDLLRNYTARTMLANSEFLVILNQASTDRKPLAEHLHMSDAQLSYITNQPAGHGLLKCGRNIVPFVNEFPNDKEIYWLITTKPGERAIH